MSKEVGKLEEEAFKRKERLKNLKRKFEGHKEEPNQEPNGNGEKENPVEIPK